MGHVVVSDGHTFGHTGGARGVDDVSDIVCCWRRKRGAGLSGYAGVGDIDDGQVTRGQP